MPGVALLLNFNPRPPCGGRPAAPLTPAGGDGISIHAPRVGGDEMAKKTVLKRVLFQSTPPVWGATAKETFYFVEDVIFQSTPPVWGATPGVGQGELAMTISIHAPRVGGDMTGSAFFFAMIISIHAPRVGGDFLKHFIGEAEGISIHAPRVGGDTRRPASPVWP